MTAGLVRSLVEWVPTSATWAGIVAGPLVLLGYLAGSIPLGYLLARSRLRRQLDEPVDHRRQQHPSSATSGRLSATALGEVGGAVIALLAATVAWDVGLQAAPRGGFSAVGTYANQAIGAWTSIALWTGLAAVVGTMVPIWARFRGGTGIIPAAALLVVYAPLLMAAGAITAGLVYALTADVRRSLLAALPVMVAVSYLAWIADWQTDVGVAHGPELSLWVTVMAGALAARNGRMPAADSGNAA